ncbi:RHS repeat domain-containing protein [Flavobacterium rhizosphaerae]|uniref:YD repeat-containing protein n=1 Tax=Flavobacterium rhizosphaerae TaxID=3163298 RepID=A0ABW8YYN7_9FLAO
MKFFCTAFIAMLLLTSCKKEENEPKQEMPAEVKGDADLVFYGLKGNVKSVSEKSFALDANGNETGPGHENPSSHDIKLMFDQNGMLVNDESWTKMGQPFGKTEYKEGRLKKKIEVQFMNGKPAMETEYIWDLQGGNNIEIIKRSSIDQKLISRIEMKYESGRMTEKNTFNRQNNPTDKIKYTYDNQGNLVKEEQYLNSEYVQVKTVYKYDEANKKIVESQYSKDSLVYNMSYKYDGDNVIEKKATAPDGTIQYSQEFTYDNKGNVLTQTIYDSFDNSTLTDTYVYDDAGNKAKWSVEKNGKKEADVFYEYDKEKNMTSAKALNGEGASIENRKYTFEYDDKGNWVKKTIFIGETPKFVIKRDIVYY